MNCSVKIYRIRHAGYFQDSARKPEFGTAAEVVSNFFAWQSGREIRMTGTNDSLKTTGHMPLYVFGAELSTDGSCIVLWNEVATSNRRVRAISGVAKTGTSKITGSGKFGDNDIPGFPTYYWIDAANDVVGVCRFPGEREGVLALERYFTKFMALHDPCVQKKLVEQNTYEITGYEDPKGKIRSVGELKPRFEMQCIRQHGKLELLREKRDRIRKVIRKETLRVNQKNDRALISQLTHHLGFAADGIDTANAMDVRFKSELDIRPTEDELDAMIEMAMKWAEGTVRDSWANIGVMFEKDSTVYWLAKVLAELDVPVTANRGKMGVFHPDALAHGLNPHAAKFAGIVADDREREEAEKKKRKEEQKKRREEKKAAAGAESEDGSEVAASVDTSE